MAVGIHKLAGGGPGGPLARLSTPTPVVLCVGQSAAPGLINPPLVRPLPLQFLLFSVGSPAEGSHLCDP
jgi:hypothetical protein